MAPRKSVKKTKRGKSAKRPARTGQMVARNREQKLPSNYTKALSSRRAAQLQDLALRNQDDLAPDARRALLESRETLLKGDMDWTVADEKRRRRYVTQVNSKVAEALKLRIGAWNDLVKWKDIYTDLVRPTPTPVDHSFWWAETHWHNASGMTSKDDNDGLRFFGGPKINDWDGRMTTSFGATGSFAIGPERLPMSPTGWFSSSPHVELFGGVVAYSANWDLLEGDGVCDCRLVVRQNVFQWKFGQSGPVAQTVAQGINDSSWFIRLENTGYSKNKAMPGFQPVPALRFHESQFNRIEPLWSEIEVRFDIFLNSAGSLLWCDPSVLLRMFQWPLEPA